MKVNIFTEDTDEWATDATIISLIPQGSRYKVIYWDDNCLNPLETIINTLNHIEKA